MEDIFELVFELLACIFEASPKVGCIVLALLVAGGIIYYTTTRV